MIDNIMWCRHYLLTNLQAAKGLATVVNLRAARTSLP